MIQLPDWAGYLLLAAAFPGAALLINWGHASDTLRGIRQQARGWSDGDDDVDLEGL